MNATPDERPYGMDEPCQADPAAHRAGLRYLAQLGALMLALVSLSYIAPLMAALRPWLPGDGLPIARCFAAPDACGAGEASVATGGAETGGEPSGLDSAALAALAEDEAASEPARTRASDEEPSEEGEVGPSTPAQRRGPRVDPRELEGLTQRIEDPNGAAMRAFYTQLYRTAAGEAGAVTRVAQYGDSSIALDGITLTVRGRMQQRFGDGGHGFILPAKGSLPYRHHGVRRDSDDEWRLMDITHLPLRDGRYGYGGYQARATRASAWVSTADEDSPVGTQVSRFDVLYQRWERGGRLELTVDDGEPFVLDTRGESVSDEVHTIQVPDGPHRLSIRAIGHGESRLYGAVLERAGPAVVYDSLGMVGARARRFLGFDRDHLARQLELRQTNLVVIGYGGNDADDERSEEDFESDFRQVAQLVRSARPGASCLFFAPLDQAERDERGRITTLPMVPRIVTAMRRAALSEGCAFFDTFVAMGGEGAMQEWFRAHPRLAFADFRHATPAGYRVIGTMFYKALLAGFADYIARR